MKIYLASSWKMKQTVSLMAVILKDAGHEVDSFCSDDGIRKSFDWDELTEIMEEEGIDISKLDAIEMMNHWRVRAAFKEDKTFIDWADVLIMIMPCGRSSHLEAGYAVGKGKKMYIIGGFEKGEFDVMYGFANGMYDYSDVDHLLGALELDDKWCEK